MGGPAKALDLATLMLEMDRALQKINEKLEEVRMPSEDAGKQLSYQVGSPKGRAGRSMRLLRATTTKQSGSPNAQGANKKPIRFVKPLDRRGSFMSMMSVEEQPFMGRGKNNSMVSIASGFMDVFRSDEYTL